MQVVKVRDKCTTNMNISADFNQYVANVVIGWLVSLLTLISVHLLLWRQPWRLKPPAPYAIGMLIILFGCAVWAGLQSQNGPISPWLALIAFGGISTSGSVIFVAYYVHGGVRSLKEMVERQNHARRAVDRVLEGLENRGETKDPRRN
jgi:hypothetical protein